jgi:predicted DNA-binding transcriptional regulator YafY
MDYLSYSLRLENILEGIKKGNIDSPHQLADKYSCSEKTIRRMINHLRARGHDIEYCRRTRKYKFLESEYTDMKCP